MVRTPLKREDEQDDTSSKVNLSDFHADNMKSNAGYSELSKE